MQESFRRLRASDEVVNNRQAPGSRKSRVSRHVKVVLVSALVFFIVALIAVEYGLHHAGPILRGRVIQSLSTRFNSQVELGEFHVSIYRGVDVQGKNLSLRSNLYPDLPPQIRVGQFGFHAGVLDLFRRPMHVHLVELHGLSIKIPPKSERVAMPKTKKHGESKINIVLDRIECDDASLVILTDNPNKIPLQFKIHALTLRRVGSGKPMHFDAHLVNPKPIGDIASQGNFGPWNAEQPHDTPVDGTYSFTHADLSTTHGIAGILSSKGNFSGPLDTLTVDGTTDTPDFSVDVSGQKVDLRTQFHAIVDGTNGDTQLQPVHAQFLNTKLTATGHVVRGPEGHGHDIALDVVIDKGRIEDLLRLGAKTTPPVMNGAVHLTTKLDLPTGKDSVSRRLRLRGRFDVENALFSNPHIQEKLNELSLRSQGRTDEIKQRAQGDGSGEIQYPDAHASIRGTFSMAHQKITFPQLVCSLPGAQIALAGAYTLDGKQFDFTGHARMQAHISSIVGGWKGALLKPIDPFFAKHGAGTDIPIKITGTKSSPHFGLNF